jgi:Kelch motif/Galactose oxidase, central domain
VKFGLLLSLVLIAVAGAQPPNAFTATSDMSSPRFFHTATLLTDGRVLIAGGSAGAQGWSTAELFDPATGGFTPTSNMTTGRFGHSATLLADGRVLIAGGWSDGPDNALSSAELYDPVTGTFTVTGSLISPRGGHTATLLQDGRVLIAGELPGAEIYDPTTGVFTPAGDMQNLAGDVSGLVSFAAAAPLPNGTVLVGTQIFQPSTGTFTATSYAGYPFAFDTDYTATTLMDGRAFIAGGSFDSDFNPCLSTTELFDPATMAFSDAPKMTLCRWAHTATLLPSGWVLIAGGGSYDAGPYQANLQSVEIYDFPDSVFGWIGNMITGRQRHTATLLPDGRVLLAGGIGAPGYSALASAEIYSPPVLIPPAQLLSVSGDGTGQGAIQHASTYQSVSADNPASTGEAIIVYCTGLIEGSVIPPQISIGGQMAEVLWFGATPGYPGLNQINVLVPSGIVAGDAVSVRLNYMGRPSNAVTIGVR